MAPGKTIPLAASCENDKHLLKSSEECGMRRFIGFVDWSLTELKNREEELPSNWGQFSLWTNPFRDHVPKHRLSLGTCSGDACLAPSVATEAVFSGNPGRIRIIGYIWDLLAVFLSYNSGKRIIILYIYIHIYIYTYEHIYIYQISYNNNKKW
jgi:hypothetical protein